MGTQFWWFYDVLTVTIAGGLLYAAVAKGFNKIVFSLIGCILAFVVGFFGSGYLSAPAYEMLYREKIESSFQITCEELDLYDAAAQNLRQSGVEGIPEESDNAFVQEAVQKYCETGEMPAWLPYAAGEVLDTQVINKITPSPETPLRDAFTADETLLHRVVSAYNAGDLQQMARELEASYMRPAYLKTVRLGVFLLLEAVVLIIVGIIAAMAGNPEELMHLRRLNRPLAVVGGMVEAACVLLSVAVAVKLVVTLTEGMMLLFNEQTVERTKIFRYIYELM